MQEFFSVNYSGEPFILFGSAHLTALGIVFLLNLALIFYGPRLSKEARNTLRYGLAAILLIGESSWHIWHILNGMWTVQTMLPLHLCSVLVWLSIVMLINRNYAIYEFAYLLGIAGALQALLTPDAGIYGFPHFRFFQTMFSHGAIVTSAVFMTTAEGFRPTLQSIKRVMIGANLYMVFVGLVNWALGSNYLFIAHKPETASVLDMLPAWPWYILFIELLGIIFVALLYAPFAIRDWRQSRVRAYSG